MQLRRPLSAWIILPVAILTYCDGGESLNPIEKPSTSIDTVRVSPATVVLVPGGRQSLNATALTASGDTVTGQTAVWSSSSPGVASVDDSGNVTAGIDGSTTITAAVGGKSGKASVTVVTPPANSDAQIVLNPTIRHQTIIGWEAHTQSGHETKYFDIFRDELFNDAANDLGINRLRLAVWAGAENTQDYYTQWRNDVIDDATWRCYRFATVNDNNDPNTINANGFHFSQMENAVENVVLPMKQRLEARGEKLHLNLLYTAFTKQSQDPGCPPGLQYHHDDSPAEYAEFILAATLHLKNKYGLTPDSWEVILEPENTTFWRGKQIGEAIVATAARLKAQGYTPRFVAPSTTRTQNAVPYLDQLIQQVPAALPYISELSYHRYSSVTPADLQLIAARAEQHGLSTSMLEHIASGYEDLHDDLKIANISAWQQFALAFPTKDDGAQYYTIDTSDPTDPQVNIASRTKYLRQYFKYIRRGAVRIDAATAVPAFDPVAFINPDGKFVVVVKANTGGSFTVGGLPSGTYGITYTTGIQYDRSANDVQLASGQSLTATIPIKGVLTIYGK